MSAETTQRDKIKFETIGYENNKNKYGNQNKLDLWGYSRSKVKLTDGKF